MVTPARTYLVECYTPGIAQDAIEATAQRAREAVEAARITGRTIEYVNAIFVPDDEVVFHTFLSDDIETVRQASVAAGIPFERIIESVAVGDTVVAGSAGDEGTDTPGELSASGV